MAWFDDRPPGCVASVAGLLPSEQACADRGVEAVGTDQGIPAFLRAVDEEGRNALFVLLETRACRAQAHVLLAKLPQQEVLEVGPVDGGAGGAQPLLEFVCRHIRECLPAPGEDPGGRSRGTEPANFFGEAELIECPDGVRCQEQPGSNLPELAGALEDDILYASPPQRDGCRETAYAGSDGHRLHPSFAPLLMRLPAFGGSMPARHYFGGDRRRGSLARGCSLLALAQRLMVALPPLAHLLLGRAQVVGRGCERKGPLHLHEHDGPDLAFDPALAVELQGFVEQISLREHHTGALEAVPLARDGVDDVDLDRRVPAQVLDRARRADVGKDEPIGVPEGCGALGREVGRTVGADGRGVAEALLFHHAPHLLAYHPHASLLGTLWLPFARNASPGETSGTIAGTRPPLPPDLSHQRRVDDHVPERLDRGHVGGTEQPVRLEQDRHLPPVAARPVRNPAEVHDCVDGPVGHLRGELVFEQVERGERVEVRAGRGVAQVRRQPVAERRHPGAQAGVRAVPTEQLSDLPPERPESAGGAGPASRRIARGDLPHQPREVVRAARRRQRPHVLQPEVAGDLVDAPGPGGVRGVREPHSWTSILGILPSSESPANIYQESW